MVVLQQNSAADLSMLVLESLEKAEVDVADELLGENSTLCGALICMGFGDWVPPESLHCLQSHLLVGGGVGFYTSKLIVSWDSHTGRVP